MSMVRSNRKLSNPLLPPPYESGFSDPVSTTVIGLSKGATPCCNLIDVVLSFAPWKVSSETQDPVLSFHTNGLLTMYVPVGK